ncbi:MAG: hypothetical protein FRX49_12711 [Trebouxia sp. A1-2]|nr:MAG: hypothetical protein FRX49_12711 [Trebouxia sp. A1-2]
MSKGVSCMIANHLDVAMITALETVLGLAELYAFDGSSLHPVCLEVEIVQYKAAQPQGNSRLTSAVNSKASSVPRQDKARLAVMRWVLRFLDPAAANTPDSNSSNPSTCAQHQWCVRNMCKSNKHMSMPEKAEVMTTFRGLQKRNRKNAVC